MATSAKGGQEGCRTGHQESGCQKAAPAKKVVAKKVVAKAAPAAPTPLKDKFTKASLATHIAERAAVEVKAVKAVLVALENVVLSRSTRRARASSRCRVC